MFSNKWSRSGLGHKLLLLCVCVWVCGWVHKSPSPPCIFYEGLSEKSADGIRILHFLIISIQTTRSDRGKYDSSENSGWKQLSQWASASGVGEAGRVPVQICDPCWVLEDELTLLDQAEKLEKEKHTLLFKRFRLYSANALMCKQHRTTSFYPLNVLLDS